MEVTNYSYPCDNRLKLTILKDVTEEKLNRDLWERIQKNEEALAKKNMQERLSSEFNSKDVYKRQVGSCPVFWGTFWTMPLRPCY